jgi:hypothetical protein
MNKDEYNIINKTAIQKRIEELENTDDYFSQGSFGEHKFLKQVLSQSTPLIPEIDKAYEAGILDKELSLTFDNPKSRYLNSLKLDL